MDIEIRKQKISEMQSLIDLAKSENRKLTDDEDAKVLSIKEEIVKSDEENKQEEIRKQEELKNTENKKNNNKKMNERFSLIKAIRDIADNRQLDEATQEIVKSARSEFAKAGLQTRGQIQIPLEKRAEILAGTQYAGQEIVAEDKLSLMGALRASSVLMAAGCTMLSNLVSDISIPVYAGSSADWVLTETANAGDGGSTFTEIGLSPKRLTTYIDISKQFLAQDSISAEALLLQDLVNAINVKLEATILGTASGNTSFPAGIFYNASYTSSGTTTWSNVVALESAVSAANGVTNGAKFLMHPTTLGVMKTTAKASNQAMFIYENANIAGYPVLTTTNMPTISGAAKGVAFGNWQDLVIGSWANIDILVDPYTVAIAGKVRIVVNCYFDAKVRRAASFSFGALA